MSLTIGGTYTTGITLTDATPSTVSVTGTVAVAYGYAIGGYGGNGESWTINNAGVLQAADARVINLGSIAGPVAYGAVTNEGGGTIAGATYGIAINGPGSVTNKTGATIAAGLSQAIFIYGAGTVANAGVISAGNVGVYLAAGGGVSNSSTGTIFGAGGVWMQQTGTVLNAGVITGTSAGFGAVSFESYTNGNRLIVDPGAVFNGNVSGGGGVLELAEGASAGTLTGLGGSITNFTTLVFDPHAQWTVAGDAAGLAGLIEGFDPLVTIDLTGFAATGANFAYNELQLSDGSGNYATLQIQGGFTNNNFNLASDNNGGVLITESLVAGTYNWIAANDDWTMPGDWDHGSEPGATDEAVIASNVTVAIGAGETVAINNVVLGPGTLDVEGTLQPGGTIAINNGMITLGTAGLIQGGTIADPSGGGVTSAGGTLSAVSYLGVLQLNAGAELNIVNGLSISDATGTNPGTIELSGRSAAIDFIDSQTFDNGTIDLDGTLGNAIGIAGSDGTTLTLGPNAVIDSEAMSAQASVDSVATAQTALVNQGTIIAGAADGSFDIDTANGFANQGSIAVTGGDTLTIDLSSGVFANSGMLSVDAGSTLRLAASMPDNTGTIVLAAGATLAVAENFDVTQLGSLINQGGTIEIDGTLDGQGATLALGNGTTLGAVVLRGAISNAVIEANNALSVGPGSAALLDDTYAGALALDTDATTLTINEGVTFTDATGLLPGSISVIGQNDTLAFANAVSAASAGQVLDHVTIDIGNALAPDVISAGFNGGTFVIGAGADIASSISAAHVTLAAGTGTEILLDGTLDADASNGMFALSAAAQSAFVNDGHILAANGDMLRIGTPMSGTGTVEIATHGIADVAATVAAGGTFAFTDATGTLMLSQPAGFAAAIAGFATGDTIDLAGVTATAATWSAGELTIRNGTTAIGTLSMVGDYSSTPGFAVHSDGNGGADIAIGAPAPQIAGLPATQALPLQPTETLFAAVQVTDASISNIDTATVSVSAPSAGALKELGTGSYDAATGVYTVAGAASALTAAIDELHFAPAASASALISTVTFALSVEGPGGGSGVSTTTLTEVQQLTWLAGETSGPLAISSSANGQSFAPAAADHTNEAVVTAPSPGGSYALPAGYQAEILGGSAGATLTDTTVGNAMLFGNSGNDSIVGGAGNDSLVGGSGNNTLIGGSGAIAISVGGGDNFISALGAGSFAISTGNGNNTVAASGSGTISGGSGANLVFGGNGATIMSAGSQDTIAGLGGAQQVQATGPGALVFGDFIGSAGVLGLTVAGSNATVSAGSSPALVALTGGSALVFGGFSSTAGSLSVNDTGSNNTVSGGFSNTAVTLGGSNNMVFGGFGSVAGTLQVMDAGSGDTIAGGNSAATISAGAGPILVFGGSGNLNFVGGAGSATVTGGTGATTISGGSGPMLVYGGSGPLSFDGGSSSSMVVAGSGSATITAGSGPTSMVPAQAETCSRSSTGAPAGRISSGSSPTARTKSASRAMRRTSCRPCWPARSRPPARRPSRCLTTP